MQNTKSSNLSRGVFSLSSNKCINVVGTSGAGKTTLAQQLAQLIAIPHVELDSLHWLPNWQEAPSALFRAHITAALAGDAWVVDGNYSHERDLIIGRADTLIWLDYSLAIILWRIITRTLRRSLTRVALWNGNRESLRLAFFSRNSVIWWALTTFKRRRREYRKLIASAEYNHLTILHFTSPGKTRKWLESLALQGS